MFHQCVKAINRNLQWYKGFSTSLISERTFHGPDGVTCPVCATSIYMYRYEVQVSALLKSHGGASACKPRPVYMLPRTHVMTVLWTTCRTPTQAERDHSTQSAPAAVTKPDSSKEFPFSKPLSITMRLELRQSPQRQDRHLELPHRL